MGELKLSHGWMSTILAKILESVIKKKLGYDAKINLNRVQITTDDNMVYMSLDVGAQMTKDEFNKMVKTFIWARKGSYKGSFFFFAKFTWSIMRNSSLSGKADRWICQIKGSSPLLFIFWKENANEIIISTGKSH